MLAVWRIALLGTLIGAATAGCTKPAGENRAVEEKAGTGNPSGTPARVQPTSVTDAVAAIDLRQLEIPADAQFSEQKATTLFFSATIDEQAALEYLREQLEPRGFSLADPRRVQHRFVSFEKDGATLSVRAERPGDVADRCHVIYWHEYTANSGKKPPLPESARDVCRKYTESAFTLELPIDEAAATVKAQLGDLGWFVSHEMQFMMTWVGAERDGLQLGSNIRTQEGSPSSVVIFHAGNVDLAQLPRLQPRDGLARHRDGAVLSSASYVSEASVEEIEEFCTAQFAEQGWARYRPIVDRTISGHKAVGFYQRGMQLQVLMAPLDGGGTEVMYGASLLPFDLPIPPGVIEVALDMALGHFYIVTTDEVRAMVEFCQAELASSGWQLDEGRSRTDDPRTKLVFTRDGEEGPSLLEVWSKDDRTLIEFRPVTGDQLRDAFDE